MPHPAISGLRARLLSLVFLAVVPAFVLILVSGLNQRDRTIAAANSGAIVAVAEANQALARDLIGLGIVAILAFLAAWIGSDLFVLRRVRSLVTTAKQLGSGDLSVRTGIPYRESELGQLAHEIDTMAESLSRHQQRLQQSERLEAVGQHVARDGRVERPQENGAEQHQVDGPRPHRPQ